MKNAILLCLFILLMTAACAKQDSNSPQGGWQMVQMQMNDKGKLTNYFSDRYVVNQTKMWDGNHFIFVGKYQVDTAITYRYGVGTWTLNGNIYEEDILYHFDKTYEGRKNKIWLEIKNDTLLHIFPVNDQGVPASTHWIERYVKLK
jgi:hypothetical protein